MCGINGIVALRPGGAVRDARAILRMNDALAHRGPDGEGVFEAPGIALGHRRLAILDLSDAGRQPMHDGYDDLVLVFNGEIYNYLEIAEELRRCGRTLRSRSDSEVLLQAYAEWGEACVHKFNGMWAFAIWSRRQRTLFISRDRLGVKPLHYAIHDDTLYFSSEPGALRSVLPLDRVNEGKLFEFLAYGYRRNDGETFLQDVRELMPGHSITIDAQGRQSVRRYWSLPARRSEPCRLDEAAEQFEALISSAVQLRMRSDVPVALLQSGGLDSSIICRMVSDDLERRAGSGEQITAFTAVNPGHHFDETALVEELLRDMPRIRLVKLASSGTALASEFTDYIRDLQEPQFSATSYAHWRLMRLVREQGVKVVLNGQGADESFAGYGLYIRGYRVLDAALQSPAEGWREARAIRRGMPWGWGSLLAQTAKAAFGRRAASAWRSRVSEASWWPLSPTWRAAQGHGLPEVAASLSPDNLDRHLRSQLLDYGFNQILNYEDFSSMSQGIEIRSPFVDYRLMEFAFSLPDEAKFHRGETKRVMRKAFRGRLPASIVDAKLKMGFGTAIDEWWRAPAMRQLVADTVHDRRFRQRPFWDADRLAKALLDPQAVARGFPAWRFLVAEHWLRHAGIGGG